MARKYTYHRENCNCILRDMVTIQDKKIILSGKHAFEWSITIYSKEKIIRTEYPNGKLARKEFTKYKIKRG